MKKTLALCTPIPEKQMEYIKEQCDITICGELKHGKGNVTEEMTKEECMGHELVVLGDEYAGADTIKAWAESGMKFMGVAKGTPATVDHNAIKEAGLELSYTPGRNRVAVAEFTIGLMIAVARKLTLSCTGLSKGEHVGEPMEDIYDVPDVKNVTFGPLDEKHPFVDYGIGFELYGKKLGVAGYGAIGAGIPPYEIKKVVTVVKAYSSAVGAGSFVSEIFGDEADELRRRGGDGGEFGATTGRPRRMGWFDAVATRYGVRMQGTTEVALTVVDVLGYLDEIPMCVGYEIDGKVTKDFPTTSELEKAKPVLKTLPGWKCDIRGIKNYEDLPKECRDYVEAIEKEIEAPITMVSNGPGRHEIIHRVSSYSK